MISVDVLVTLTSSKLHKPTKRLSLPDRKPLALIGVYGYNLPVTLSYKTSSVYSQCMWLRGFSTTLKA